MAQQWKLAFDHKLLTGMNISYYIPESRAVNTFPKITLNNHDSTVLPILHKYEKGECSKEIITQLEDKYIYW